MAELREIMIPKSELMTLGRKELEERARKIGEDLADNGWGTLNYLALTKRMEHFVGVVLSTLKSRGVNELRQYSKGQVMTNGVQMSQEEVGVKFIYDSDPVWLRFKEEEEAIASQRKAWEAKLKAIKKLEGEFLVDETTGEEYLAHRPSRIATDSIKLSIV